MSVTPIGVPKEIRISKWYFGGFASAIAACITHPLDLLKVQMQTQKGKNISMMQTAAVLVRREGVVALYNGISASLLRQLTYSMARFGIYEQAKQQFTKDDRPISAPMSIFFAGVGGLVGGLVGNPADLVNVRMQNDIKLPLKQRRKYVLVDENASYNNAIHGLWRVAAAEGVTALWMGASMTCSRAVLMTIGQAACYDLIKDALLTTPYFQDNVITHGTSSLLAGGVATTLSQPVDVLKTRAMNAKPGEFRGVLHLITCTAKEGPLVFYKGYIPAFARLAPHTILLFIFLEQMKLKFGTIKKDLL